MEASTSASSPRFSGGAIGVSTGQAAALDALCEALRLTAKDMPSARGEVGAIVLGLRTIAEIAQSGTTQNADQSRTGAWQAMRQQMTGVVHVLLLNKPDSSNPKTLICRLAAQNRPADVAYAYEGEASGDLAFTVVRDAGNWVLRGRYMQEPVELALGDVSDLNWAPTPLETKARHGDAGVALFLSNLTAKLPPVKDESAPRTRSLGDTRRDGQEPPAQPDRSESESRACTIRESHHSGGLIWYYVRDDRQYGPVNDAALRQLFLNGTLTVESLLWNPALTEWKPARDSLPSMLKTPVPPPLPAKAPSPPPPPPPQIEWHYAEAGRPAGPVPEAELRRLLNTRQLPAETLVWRAGFTEWQDAMHAGLAPAPPKVAQSSAPPPLPAPAEPASMPLKAETPEHEQPALTTCRQCGAVLREGKRYCFKCGADISPAGGESRPK